MERRQAVKALGAMAGAGLLLPDAVLARAGEALEGTPPKRRFFNGTEKRIVAGFAECVVPRTDTPGAADVGVAGWVEILVEDCYEYDEQQEFREGLMEIDQAARDRFQKGFNQLAYAQQVQLLTDIERPTSPALQPTAMRRPRSCVRSKTWSNSCTSPPNAAPTKPFPTSPSPVATTAQRLCRPAPKWKRRSGKFFFAFLNFDPTTCISTT